MRFHYEPGLYGLSDFSGKTLALRTGRGERDVEIFVAVLAHSNLIYAEAVPDQSQQSRTPSSTASSTTRTASTSAASPSESATNRPRSTARTREPRPDGRGPWAPAAPSWMHEPRRAAACLV